MSNFDNEPKFNNTFSLMVLIVLIAIVSGFIGFISAKITAEVPQCGQVKTLNSYDPLKTTRFTTSQHQSMKVGGMLEGCVMIPRH